MLAIPLNPAAWLSEFVVGLVEVYQRRISPFKGFRCAHRVLKGGRSCSEHAKQVVRRWGVWKLWPLLCRRFERCGKAKRTLDYESKVKPAAAEDERAADTNSCWRDGAHEACGEVVGHACSVGIEGASNLACEGLGACDCGGF